MVAVPPGTWLQLTASVSGWAETSVTWSLLESQGCGIVTLEGFYLAPETALPSPCHVAAISNADPAKNAIAEVTVAVQAYAEANAASLKALLGTRVLGAGGATSEIRANLGALIPHLNVPADAVTWGEEAAALRRALLDGVVFSGRAAAWREANTRVEWLDWIEGGPGYRIRKMRYEAVPGLWIPGLLYMPEGLSGRAPVMLHLIGHWPDGKAEKQLQTRAISLAKHGVIGLSVDWYWTGQLGSIDALSGNNHGRLHQIGLSGASGLAPFYLAVSRAIDALQSLPEVDPTRIGVTGASGGGWQSIWIGALDERVALVNPVAGFSALPNCLEHPSDVGDFEQLPVDMGAFADFTHLAALVAPRALLLTYNAYDECCFRADYALQPIFDAALAAYQVHGVPEALRMHVNYAPGSHNFGRDNREALYRLMGDYFFPGDANWDATESDVIELKTAAELNVDLPPDNGHLHQLALDLAGTLPARSPTPTAVAGAVRAHVWGAERGAGGVPQLAGDVAVRSLTLRVGSQWTVPAVELVPTDSAQVAIVIADGGRSASAPTVAQLLADGNRVLVVDPFGYGESYLPGANLMALTSALGERPLGMAASQVAAIARLIANEQGGAPSTLVALGPQTSMVALVAAALEPQAIGALDLQGALASLTELLALDASIYGMRFVWCQGLLEVAEVDDLVALASPRPVTFR
jgi:dienelactone hydrolase